MRIGQVIVALRVYFQVVEADEWSLVIVVEDCLPIQSDRVDSGEVRRLLWPAVSHHVQFAVAVYAAVYIPCRRVGLDASQVVGLQIQQILPVMMAIVTFGRRTPFDEVKAVGLWDITWRFVDLKRQSLQLLYCCVGPDDVEESFIVGHEA